VSSSVAYTPRIILKVLKSRRYVYKYICIYDVCVCIRGTNLITPHVTHTHTTVCTGYTGKLMLVCLSMRDERGIKINSTLVLTYMTL
jgi:hypothetical protein